MWHEDFGDEPSIWERADKELFYEQFMKSGGTMPEVQCIHRSCQFLLLAILLATIYCFAPYRLLGGLSIISGVVGLVLALISGKFTQWLVSAVLISAASLVGVGGIYLGLWRFVVLSVHDLLTNKGLTPGGVGLDLLCIVSGATVAVGLGAAGGFLFVFGTFGASEVFSTQKQKNYYSPQLRAVLSKKTKEELKEYPQSVQDDFLITDEDKLVAKNGNHPWPWW